LVCHWISFLLEWVSNKPYQTNPNMTRVFMSDSRQKLFSSFGEILDFSVFCNIIVFSQTQRWNSSCLRFLSFAGKGRNG
jgi:hypothetical protein